MNANQTSTSNRTRSSTNTRTTVAAHKSRTYGTVHTDDVSKQIWLAKIPQKLQQAWQTASEGDVLGTLTFTKPSSSKTNDGNVKSKNNSSMLQIQIQPPSDDTSGTAKKDDLPLEYSIEALTKKVPGKLHPIRRSDEDGSIIPMGTIARSCNLQVQVQSRQYAELLKSRLISTVQSSRYVKPVDSNDVSLSRDAAAAALEAKSMHKTNESKSGNIQAASFADSIALYGQQAIQAKSQAAEAAALNSVAGISGSKKRKFDAGQSLRSIIFELYSTQQFWTVKEIRAAAPGFPDAEVRAELQELCDFHRSGEQRGSWELKKEFQQQAST